MTVATDSPDDPWSVMTLRDALEWTPIPCACSGCHFHQGRCGFCNCQHIDAQGANLIRAAHIVARLLTDERDRRIAEVGQHLHDTYCTDPGHPGTSSVVATAASAWNIHAPTETEPGDTP